MELTTRLHDLARRVSVVTPLSRGAIGSWQKGLQVVHEYFETAWPRFHYFGDVYQRQATRWHYADTLCVDDGYFRVTGKAVRHD